MKLKLFIIGIIAIVSTNCYSQKYQVEYGLNFNPSLTLTEKYKRPPAFNYAAGLYMSINLSKRIELGGSLNYRQLNLNTELNVDCDPSEGVTLCVVPSQDEFRIISIPTWLSIDMNYTSEPRIKPFLVIGYSFGKLIDHSGTESNYQLWGLKDNVHSGFFGVDWKAKLTNQYQITFGSHIDVTNIYNARYGDIYNLKFVVRIGRI